MYNICGHVQDSEVSTETRKHYSCVSFEVALFATVCNNLNTETNIKHLQTQPPSLKQIVNITFC